MYSYSTIDDANPSSMESTAEQLKQGHLNERHYRALTTHASDGLYGILYCPDIGVYYTFGNGSEL